MNIRSIRQQARGTVGAALCASAALMFGAPAFAQGVAEAPAQQQAPANVSDAQVEAFAKAQERVIEIGQKWNGKLQEAGSPEEIESARESAHQEMSIAVESLGLSVDDYNRIAIAMQTDPQLQQRVRAAQSSG